MQPRTRPTFYLKVGVKAPLVTLLDQKWENGQQQQSAGKFLRCKSH